MSQRALEQVAGGDDEGYTDDSSFSADTFTPTYDGSDGRTYEQDVADYDVSGANQASADYQQQQMADAYEYGSQPQQTYGQDQNYGYGNGGYYQYDDGSSFQSFPDGSTLAQDTDGNYTSTFATDGAQDGQDALLNPAGWPISPADNSVVFRGDRPSMDPARIFENGFQPKGPIDDLLAHVMRNGAGTNFVSTSRDFSVAEGFASRPERTNGWIYQLNGAGGISTAEHLNSALYTTPQSEVVFRGGVPGSQVEGAYKVTRGEVGPFIPNEGYVPPMSNTARAGLGGAGGILAYEAINAGLPYARQGVQALENNGYTGTAAAIRETGNIANDFLAGAAPVATGVSSGLQYLGVPQRYADWSGIVADTAVRVFPPTGVIYNPVSLGLGVGNAAIGAGSRNFSGGGTSGSGWSGTFTDPMGGLVMP